MVELISKISQRNHYTRWRWKYETLSIYTHMPKFRHMVKLGLMVFWFYELFSLMVEYLVFQIYIYSVLWIRSTGPAWTELGANSELSESHPWFSDLLWRKESCKKMSRKSDLIHKQPIRFKIQVSFISMEHVTFKLWASRIGLEFLNPTLQLKRWDVTSLCMQLRKREERISSICLGDN